MNVLSQMCLLTTNRTRSIFEVRRKPTRFVQFYENNLKIKLTDEHRVLLQNTLFSHFLKMSKMSTMNELVCEINHLVFWAWFDVIQNSRGLYEFHFKRCLPYTRFRNINGGILRYYNWDLIKRRIKHNKDEKMISSVSAIGIERHDLILVGSDNEIPLNGCKEDLLVPFVQC